MSALARLHADIAAVCPIVGVAVPTLGTSVGARIDYDPSATAPQRAAADAVLAAFDWTPALDAVYEARQAKAKASDFYDRAQTAQAEITDRVVIAFAQLVLERFNFTAGKFNDLQAAIAAASSLADFKTRAAAVGNIGILTQKQLVDAIKAKIAATGE